MIKIQPSFWRDRYAQIREELMRTEIVEKLVRLNIEAERCLYEISKWRAS